MARRQSARKRKGAAAPAQRGPARMVFARQNYVLLLGSLALVVGGYVLMALDNARGLDERGVHLSLDSPLSLIIAPLLLLGGYLGLIYAILWRPKAVADAVEDAKPEAVAEAA